MKKQEKNVQAPKRPYTAWDWVTDIERIFGNDPAWTRWEPSKEKNTTTNGIPVKRYEVKIFFDNPNREEKRKEGEE